jgi:ankyrin repeat protein
MEQAYYEACAAGTLDAVQTCLGEENLDSEDVETGLHLACEAGHTHVAEWLITQHGVDVHSGAEYAFRASCAKGHLDTAKWLLTACPDIDVHAIGDAALRWSTIKGHHDVAQWLLQLVSSQP